MNHTIDIIELSAPEGACTPAAKLSDHQRGAVLRLAQIEMECYSPDHPLADAVLLGMRTRYPVLIEDRPGGGYLVGVRKPASPPTTAQAFRVGSYDREAYCILPTRELAEAYVEPLPNPTDWTITPVAAKEGGAA